MFQTESFPSADCNPAPVKSPEVGPLVPIPPPQPGAAPRPRKPGRLTGMLDYLFSKGRKGAGEALGDYLDLAQKNPGNAFFQLKLAEIYLKKGEEEKAISKFLQAAEIFGRENFFPQAMAIYKQVLSLNPHLIHANLKMGEIYRHMGFLSDAIAQFQIVAKHYETWGKKEKIPSMTELIQELEKEKIEREKKAAALAEVRKLGEAKGEAGPMASARPARRSRNARIVSPPEGMQENLYDLGAELAAGDPGDLKDIKEISTDKLFGFEEIFKELQETVIPGEVYPNFNYHMGKACREMGFTDGAIEQLQLAMQKGQNAAESAKLLSKCFRDKGWFHEAQKYFEKAMQMDHESRKKTPSFKSEIVMLHS